MYLSKNDFSIAVNLLPLISVDFCILDNENRLLFVKRNCRPAKDYLFTPGGRVRKNEKFYDAIKRISKDEIGLSLNENHNLINMGIWDHFYEDSAFDNSISTHYINIPHLIRLNKDMKKLINIKFGKDYQHGNYEWIHIEDCFNHKDIHKYPKEYSKFIHTNFF
jgi:colanic acid biosynthesis protein WcaH|tara:strand:+ start:3706 stop:4197 length:492 start_codon:yes stop_codon:yes gene_type:complete